MSHPIYRVEGVERVGTHSLRLRFDDGLVRTIDFSAVLTGELYGPLRNPKVFAQVQIDPEVRTIVWPSGADFDPAILHDWPQHEPAFRAAAIKWGKQHASAR
jgi:hypothetical protein